MENRWNYGRIHLDSCGIHFSISEDRNAWELITLKDPSHPRYVLSEADFDAVKGFW